MVAGAYGNGAGWLGGIAVGFIAGLATLLVGHVLLTFVKPLWVRLVIAAVFVAPATIAGYHATHGIVKHTMPSDTSQVSVCLPCEHERCDPTGNMGSGRSGKREKPRHHHQQYSNV